MGKLKKLLLTAFIITTAIPSFATDYYWVGGAGSWSDLSHWSNTSGGTYPSTDKVQIPQSTDDVYIDANSGLSTNGTISVSGTITYKDIIWSTGLTGVGLNGNATSQCFGSVTLEPNMRNQPLGSTIEFSSSNAEIIDLQGNSLWTVYFEPYGGDYTVVGDFMAQNIYIDNAAGSLTVPGNVECGYFDHINGTTTITGYLKGVGGGDINNVWFRGGFCTVYGGTSVIWGRVSISNNGSRFNLWGDDHYWQRGFTIIGATVNDTVDITGATVTARGLTMDPDLTWYSTGSTINMVTEGAVSYVNFTGYAKTYNNVNFLERTRINGASASTTPTIDSLVIHEGLEYLTSHSFCNIGDGSTGLLEIKPGYNNPYNISGAAVITFNISGNATTKLLGTCDNYVKLEQINFDFAAGADANLTMDYTELNNVNATGPASPYNSGTNSLEIPNSTNTGWNIGAAPTARTLYWIGPIPTNDINNTNLYGIWSDMNNWSLNPLATPNNPVGGPECIPTYIDSVVFPDSSYVRIAAQDVSCKSMHWVEDGVLFDSVLVNSLDNRILNIYGSLHFSLEMINDYWGQVHFRTWEAYPTITSNGKIFNHKVIFDASDPLVGTWSFADDFSADGHMHATTNPYWSFKVQLKAGRLQTMGFTFTVSSFSCNSSDAWLDLSSSDVFVTETGGCCAANWAFLPVNRLIAGTSHIYLSDNSGPTFTSQYNNYYDITFLGDNPRMDFTTSSTHGTNTIRNLTFNKGGVFWKRTGGTPGTPLQITQLTGHATDPSAVDNLVIVDMTPTATLNTKLEIDDAYFNGNTDFQLQTQYNNTMYLAPAKSYTITAGDTQMVNGVLDADGASGPCASTIDITGGEFYSTSAQTVNYCNITNNTARTATFTANNSQLNGTTTGWTPGMVSTGRTLYWYDNIAGNSKGDWDGCFWTTTPGVVECACPPTLIDTVIFDNTSFSGIDTVDIDLLVNAQCADMRWTHNGTFTPVFRGANNQILEIHASLIFSTTMLQNFMGDVQFKGGNVGQTITSNTQGFNRTVYFDGSGDWILQDSLVATAYLDEITLNLLQGTLNTNSKRVRIEKFSSRGTATRRLILGNTQMYLQGDMLGDYTYDVEKGTPFSIDAGTSHLIFNDPIDRQNMNAGAGHQYYNVSSIVNGQFYLATERDTFNVVTHNATSNSSLHIRSDYSNTGVNSYYLSGKSVFRTINCNRDIHLEADSNTIDSLVMKQNGFIYGDNWYNNYVEFTPGMTYQFRGGKIQHLANQCEFKPIGTGGNEIYMNSMDATVPTYIKKDSARVCADYIYIKDLHAIGNGVSLEGAPCGTPAEPWLCDTLLISSFNPTTATSGRAEFVAGANANDQGGNAGWDFSPYPPLPGVTLITPDISICDGEGPITLTFEVEGNKPLNVSYTIDDGTTLIQADSTDITTSGGTGTAGDPYIWTFTVNPTVDGTVYAALEVNNDRCFNPLSPGTGSMTVTINPLPGAGALTSPTNTEVCFNSTNIIDAASPFGVNDSIYDAATGGNNLGPIAYTTPPITVPTTYYIEFETAFGCQNPTRMPVNLTIDNVDPVAVCQNITVQLDPTGNVTILPSQINNGSSDNCSITNMSLDVSTFDCTDIGPNNVTLTVSDGAGNTDDCIATVTVEDVEDPVITTCPPDIIVPVDANCQFTLLDYTGVAAATDNCSAVITQSPVAGTVITAGQIVTITATDPSGNTDDCTFTITPQDQTPPVAVCQNITVQLDATGNVSITPAQIDNGSSDNCSIANMSLDITNFTCADLGANTVVLTVTDGAGNTDQCNATVTVEDNIDPVAVCQNITVQLDPTGNVTILPSQVNNGSSDNCSITNMNLNVSTFDCTDIGQNNVTLTVTDIAGNTAQCVAVVTVEDVEDPVITTCPPDIIVPVDANCQFTLLNYTGASAATDNCSAVITQSPGAGTTITGSQIVTITATDPSGNTATCTFTITPQDQTPPVAVCQNITVQLDATGNVSITPAQIDNGSSDNCSITNMSLDITNFTCVDLGANQVTLTVEDGSGNITTCAATVTVEDNILPTAVCQNITVQLDPTGNVTILPSQVNNGSSDNCSITNMNLNVSTFDCTDIGQNNVTLTVTDIAGNTAQCVAVVTVEDVEDPVITVCPPDIVVPVDANCQFTLLDYTGAAAATDNCSAVITQSPVAGTVITGSQVVTITATDPSGNTDDCTFTITPQDQTPPVAICQNITVQLDPTGNVSITPAQIDNGSSDNCSIANMSLDITNFTCADLGANQVTLTVTDGAGNITTCTATVTVEDNEDPVVLCQNITVQLDPTGNVTILPSQIDNGSSDNCSITNMTLDVNNFDCTDIGQNNVTLTVTDIAGNSVSCVAVVTVEDVEDPVITVCPPDVTVAVDVNCQFTLLDYTTVAAATDNCSAVITQSPVAGTTITGSQVVTITATDPSGNTDDCTFTITPQDQTPPVAICKDTTIYLDINGQVTIDSSYIDNGSSDNCSIANMSLDVSNFTCADLGANQVTLTVEDGSGNITTCTATVTVVDSILPTITCPTDKNVAFDVNCEYALLDYISEAIVSDNCGTTVTQLPAPGTIILDTQTVTLTVTDDAGNTTSCTFDVIPHDVTAPTIMCPSDLLVELESPCEYEVPDFSGQAIVGLDNCDGSSVIVSQVPLAGTIIPASDIIVQLFVQDSSGNKDSCDFNITMTCEGLLIPEFISPNGDGKNDVFEIQGIKNFPNNHLVIYNRWGNKVFSMSNYDNSWDGTSQHGLTIGNGVLPSGTYYYILQLTSEITYDGYIQLQR